MSTPANRFAVVTGASTSICRITGPAVAGRVVRRFRLEGWYEDDRS